MSEAREAAASTQDALQLLRADHRRIEQRLDDCVRLVQRRSSSPADRSGLLARLGALLLSHAQIERELFYPLLDAEPLAVDDARTDHDEIELQFRRLQAGTLSADELAKGIEGLGALLREHQAEEELHLFAAAAALDLQELGTRLALRRAELLGVQGED